MPASSTPEYTRKNVSWPNEGVVDDLECQGAEWLVVRGLPLHLLFRVVGVHALNGGNLQRGGKEVHDGVQQLLYALVFEGRTGQHRDDALLETTLAERPEELVLGEVGVTLEIALHQGIIDLGGRFDEHRARLICLRLELLRDLLDRPLGAEVVVLEAIGLHRDQVDDAFELGLLAKRKLHCNRGRAESILDRLECGWEICACLVHLVDEADARDAIPVGLAPHRLGLGLYALLGVEHGDGAIEHTKRTLDLDGEVHVPGRVDDIDAELIIAERARSGPPKASGGSGCDRDAALLLLLHVVHGRSAVVHFADLVVDARVVKDALGRGRLARIDVGHDADVAGLFEWVLPGHWIL